MRFLLTVRSAFFDAAALKCIGEEDTAIGKWRFLWDQISRSKFCVKGKTYAIWIQHQ
jgi:hypothetical protein